MNITTLSQAEQALALYRPAVKEFLGKDMSLDRMRPLMALLGNPERKLRVVHVAGTSGKTSTSHFIAHMLHMTGSKVGLTASPHVDSLLERVQVGDQPIAEAEFCAHLTEFLASIKNVEPRPTYYELLVAFVYWYFDKVQVDFAVVETGLGGLYDGTNIADSPHKICVITDIGFDHMKVLGDTLPEIAKQKAGIIHQGNYALMFEQSPEIMQVFQGHCQHVGATLQVVSPKLITDFSFGPQMPLYQQRNWTLAWSTYQYLANRYNLPVIQASQLEASRTVHIPGRMEIVRQGDKTIIYDGAHNAQKMAAFIQSFRQLYPAVKPSVLLSVRDRKDFRDVVVQLFDIAEEIILTSFHVSQDIEHRNAHLGEMQTFCHEQGYDNVITEPDQIQAYRRLLNTTSGVGVVTGSFYLIHQIKQQSQP
jgi:dihydrofolate synthase/folylpolyglutamate synthase